MMCLTWIKVVRLVLLKAIFTAVLAGTSAQESDLFARDHVFGMSRGALRYEWLLAQSIFRGFPARASVSYYEISSRLPERGFWMHPDGADYLLVAVVSKENLWYWGNLDECSDDDPIDLPVKIREIEAAGLAVRMTRKLPLPLAQRFEQVWHATLARNASGREPSHMDGTRFVFRSSSDQTGVRSLDAQDPAEGTDAMVLVAMGRAVLKFAQDGDARSLENLLNKEAER